MVLSFSVANVKLKESGEGQPVIPLDGETYHLQRLQNTLNIETL
jgi:hypothetical protein